MDRFVNNKINFNLTAKFRFGDAPFQPPSQIPIWECSFLKFRFGNAGFKVSLTYQDIFLPNSEFRKEN